MTHELAVNIRRNAPYVAYAAIGYLAAAFMFGWPPFKREPPISTVERRLVVVLDCSNSKLLDSEVNALVGDSEDELSGIVGEYLKDWKENANSRPWEIDFAYVNDKSEAIPIETVTLEPLSGSKNEIRSDFDTQVKKVRAFLELDPGRGKGTQIIRTVSSVLSRLPIDKEDETLKVAIVSNFLEQDDDLNIDMAGLIKTPTVYDSSVHDEYGEDLASAIKKYGGLDFHNSDVHLYLTRSDRSKGVHKAVLEKIWKGAFAQSNCKSCEFDVLQ
jgi:hypothetical protein